MDFVQLKMDQRPGQQREQQRQQVEPIHCWNFHLPQTSQSPRGPSCDQSWIQRPLRQQSKPFGQRGLAAVVAAVPSLVSFVAAEWRLGPWCFWVPVSAKEANGIVAEIEKTSGVAFFFVSLVSFEQEKEKKKTFLGNRSRSAD